MQTCGGEGQNLTTDPLPLEWVLLLPLLLLWSSVGFKLMVADDVTSLGGVLLESSLRAELLSPPCSLR